MSKTKKSTNSLALKTGKSLLNPRNFLLGLAAIALLSVPVGLGMSRWLKSNINAHAAVYKAVWSGYAIDISACRVNGTNNTQVRVVNHSSTTGVTIRIDGAGGKIDQFVVKANSITTRAYTPSTLQYYLYDAYIAQSTLAGVYNYTC